jgi:hypothetical protein
VFLIDHDERELGQGGEHRGTGSNDDSRLAAMRRPPGIAALAVRQARMHHHHSGAEAAAEAIDQLRCQGDFGHQHQSLAAIRDRGGNDAQVHFGLAAAGHAVDQVRGKARQGGDYGGNAEFLCLGESHFAGTRLHRRGARSEGFRDDPAARRQRPQRCGLELVGDFLSRGAPSVLEPGEQGLLLRGAPSRWIRQFLPSGLAQEPPLDRLERRLTRPQADR